MIEVLQHDCDSIPERSLGAVSTRRSFFRAAAAVCFGGAGGCSVLGKKEKVAFVPTEMPPNPRCLNPNRGTDYIFVYKWADCRDKDRASKNDYSERNVLKRELIEHIEKVWVPKQGVKPEEVSIWTKPPRQDADADEPIIIRVKIPQPQTTNASASPESAPSSRTQTPEVHQK